MLNAIKRNYFSALYDHHINYPVRKEVFAFCLPGVSKDDLLKYFDPYLTEGPLDIILDQMISTGNINFNDGKYTSRPIWFIDFVKSCDIPDKDKNIILSRLSGVRLKDLAEENGCTAENMRLIEGRILDKIHEPFKTNFYKINYGSFIFKDNLFDDVFSNVNFDTEFLAYLKNANISVYGAYRYFYTYFKKMDFDRTDIMTFLSESPALIPDEMRTAVLDFYKPIIFDNGKVFPKYKGAAYAEILRLDGPMTFDELIKAKAEGKHIAYDPKNEAVDYETEEKYLRTIFTQNEHVIRTGGNTLRYYDKKGAKDDILAVIKKLDFMGKTGKMTTAKLFNRNKDELKAVDIRNMYELHSIMRYLKKELPKGELSNIEMKKMPTVVILAK